MGLGTNPGIVGPLQKEQVLLTTESYVHIFRTTKSSSSGAFHMFLTYQNQLQVYISSL